jgi:hypothetical protein
MKRNRAYQKQKMARNANIPRGDLFDEDSDEDRLVLSNY